MRRNVSILSLKNNHHNFPHFIALTLCIITLLGLSSCSTRSEGRYKFQPESMHWLQFRGPNASGIGPENADPPVHFSPDSNVIWKTEILSGWSSPCIVNDKIFLTGFDNTDSLLYTFAIDRQYGKMLWRDSVKPSVCYSMHPINSYANPTIASDGKNIFASFMNYGAVSYDFDGNKRWEFLHEPITAFYGGANSPVIHDSLLILKVSSFEDPRIIALALEDGDSIWTIRDLDKEWAYHGTTATTLIWEDLLINHTYNFLVAYSLTDRKAIWWNHLPGNGVATPVIAGDKLFLNSYVQMGEKRLYGGTIIFSELLEMLDENENSRLEYDEFSDDMLIFQRPEIKDLPRSGMSYKRGFAYFDENEDRSIDEAEWDKFWEQMKEFLTEHGMFSLSLNGLGERPFDAVNWIVNEDTPETPSPLVVNENVLFIKNGGIVSVMNRENGELVFKERINAPGGYVSSPLLAGGRIYTCSFNGTVSVMSADDFSILSYNKLGEKIGASPVAVDDVLYVRTDKHLYAFRDP